MIVLALIKKARWETSGPNGVVTEVRAIIEGTAIYIAISIT
jgi:hypothetical protein